jgi:hypothetical protein
VSGDISVAVPAGIGVYLDLSAVAGDVRSDLEPSGSEGDAGLSLHCRSISGDVRVVRAPAQRPAEPVAGRQSVPEFLPPGRHLERPGRCTSTR